MRFFTYSLLIFHMIKLKLRILTFKTNKKKIRKSKKSKSRNLIEKMSQLPVELFNVLVMASGNFMNGCEAL